jgi:hypothetical protein
METWMIVVGAVGFTALVMVLGPWMWSSTWTTWSWGRRPKPPQDGSGPDGSKRDGSGPKPPGH